MRTLAAAYPEEITQQPAAQFAWGHLMVLLDRGLVPADRDWYAAQVVQLGWSRPALTHHLIAERHRRVGRAVTNFPAALGH